jgi:hypothetical protein
VRESRWYQTGLPKQAVQLLSSYQRALPRPNVAQNELVEIPLCCARNGWTVDGSGGSDAAVGGTPSRDFKFAVAQSPLLTFF